MYADEGQHVWLMSLHILGIQSKSYGRTLIKNYGLYVTREFLYHADVRIFLCWGERLIFIMQNRSLKAHNFNGTLLCGRKLLTTSNLASAGFLKTIGLTKFLLILITDLKGGDKFIICKNINSVSITNVIKLTWCLSVSLWIEFCNL